MFNSENLTLTYMNTDYKKSSHCPIRWALAATLVVTTLSSFNPVQAARIVVTVADLDNALYESASEPDAISRLALQKIQSTINEAGLSFDAGEILFSDSDTDIVAESGCTSTVLRTLDTTIALASGSNLAITLDSLYQPVTLSLALDTRISVSGRAKQVVGFRLGSCQELASDNFSFTANGSAQLNLSLTLNLNPTLEGEGRILVLMPEVSLSGNLIKQGITVDVTDSLLRAVLEDVLEDQIDDALSNAQIVSSIQNLQQELSGALDAQLDNGKISVELPEPTDEQINTLYTLLSPTGDFSLSLGYMRTERVSLLAALILGDTAGVNRLLSDAVQCEAAGILQTSLLHKPIYSLGLQGCEITQLSSESFANGELASTTIYSDAQCQQAVDFYETSTVDYCAQVLDTERLGNADSFQDQLDRWTLSPGTRFDIGAVPLAGKKQPFTQRIRYKSVSTAMGECSLEMRIHSAHPISDLPSEASGSERAIIAFHGGSWQRRSSGALGIESMATQFVNEGYVVFAPFYRLIGAEEGNDACNEATLDDVLEDAYDALTWVQKNGARYGVSGKPVLFGQSAGGHLAAVLAVERPTEVSNAVLFYAPTDFAEFARQLINGEIVSTTGQDILEAVVGQTLETLDVQNPVIQRNALAAKVESNPSSVPPFFLLHGQQDSVLPVSQSIRMCNAIAGNAEAGPATLIDDTTGELRKVVNCGNRGSELHLLAEGEHALDLCIAEELCLAGSPESAALTTDSINSMLRWISQTDADSARLNDAVMIGTSSGAFGYLALLILISMNLARLSFLKQSSRYRALAFERGFWLG